MKKTITLLLLMMILTLDACASRVSVTASIQPSDWTFPSGTVKSLVITNDSGNIVVRRAEDKDILITTTKSARNPDDLSKVDIQVKQTKDVISAVLNYLSGQSSVSVDFDIRVPSGLSIQIESASGNITIANYQGTLNVSTASGKIILQDVQGEIRANTDSGDIETHNVDGNFHIGSGSGNIVATYTTALQQVENPVLLSDVQTLWTYKLTSSGADSSFPKLPGNGQRIFENNSGMITLRLAHDLQADVFAQLFSSDFKSDLQELQGSADKVRYVGHLNGGGPLIILTNASGTIHVEALSIP